MGKGEGGNWNNGLFGCFGNMGNCKFIGETWYCNFAKPYPGTAKAGGGVGGWGRGVRRAALLLAHPSYFPNLMKMVIFYHFS